MPPQAVEVAPEHLAKISTLMADSRQKQAREQESLARSEALLRKLVRGRRLAEVRCFFYVFSACPAHACLARARLQREERPPCRCRQLRRPEVSSRCHSQHGASPAGQVLTAPAPVLMQAEQEAQERQRLAVAAAAEQPLAVEQQQPAGVFAQLLQQLAAVIRTVASFVRQLVARLTGGGSSSSAASASA